MGELVLIILGDLEIVELARIRLNAHLHRCIRLILDVEIASKLHYDLVLQLTYVQ